jgi:hypothetical protein
MNRKARGTRTAQPLASRAPLSETKAKEAKKKLIATSPNSKRNLNN